MWVQITHKIYLTCKHHRHTTLSHIHNVYFAINTYIGFYIMTFFENPHTNLMFSILDHFFSNSGPNNKIHCHYARFTIFWHTLMKIKSLITHIINVLEFIMVPNECTFLIIFAPKWALLTNINGIDHSTLIIYFYVYPPVNKSRNISLLSEQILVNDHFCTFGNDHFCTFLGP